MPENGSKTRKANNFYLLGLSYQVLPRYPPMAYPTRPTRREESKEIAIKRHLGGAHKPWRSINWDLGAPAGALRRR